jgi:1-acyl-sn-glycerol-3-phosphate acyltransferase
MTPLPTGPLLGIVTLLLFALVTLLWSVPLFAMTAVKLIGLRFARLRRWTTRQVTWVASTWMRWIHAIAAWTRRMHWDVEGLENLRRDESYLVLSNHRSWVDIIVLQGLLQRRIPFLRFFLKRELAFVPILGQAWWALEFPFMRRYDRKTLERRPELRSKDLEITKRFCERLENVPVAIMSFAEGTRFRPEKRDRQRSPYRHLLRAKAGGVGLALTALKDRLRHVLDVTIVYPEGRTSFWDYVCGRIHRVVVRVRVLPVPVHLLGDHRADPELAERFRRWLNDVWQTKDETIDDLLDLPAGRSAP